VSSVGQAVGGVVGGVIGFFTPIGPVMGAQIGMSIGGLLDPPKVQGPRLEDLTAQTSTYGAFIPRVYGTVALTGNVFWIQGDKLIEKEVESSGKGGPEVTNFEYFSSFAVSLCEGPIDGVRRIWVGGQLWYDAGSDDFSTIIASNETAATFTLYTGSETQLADPLIQADRGVANVPAYRGLAYLVFNELPLKDVGNSLAGAQVKVEVVMDGAPPDITSVYVQTLPEGGSGALHAPKYIKPLEKDISGTDLMGAIGGASEPYKRYRFNTYNDPAQPVFYTADSWVGWDEFSPGEYDAEIVRYSNNYTKIEVDGVEYYTGLSFGYNSFTSYIIDTGRVLWCQCRKNSLNESSFVAIDKGVGVILHTEDKATNEYVLAYDSDSDQIVLLYADRIEKFNAVSAALDSTVTLPVGITIQNPLESISASEGILWRFYVSATTRILKGYDLTTGAEAHSYSWVDSGAPGSLAAYVHRNLLVFLVDHGTAIGSRRMRIMRIDGLTTNTIPLSTIVESECLKSELLTAGDLDVTDLTDQVRGYRISSLGPLRGGIDPLRKAWPFDAVQHGYKIKFKARGGASVATITEAELDAREAGANPGIQVSNVREMDTVIPSQLTVKYLDAVREYDFNVAEETR